MSEDRWWADKQHEIEEIENDDYHVGFLCGREVDGSWEYAIVTWRYKVPTLRLLFKDGKVVQTDDAGD